MVILMSAPRFDKATTFLGMMKNLRALNKDAYNTMKITTPHGVWVGGGYDV